MGITLYLTLRKKTYLTLLAINACYSISTHSVSAGLIATHRGIAKPHHSYNTSNYQQPGPNAKIKGEKISTIPGVRITTKRIMQKKRTADCSQYAELSIPATHDRSHVIHNPHIPTRLINIEDITENKTQSASRAAPHTYGISFLGGMLSQVNMFPPDSMGAVGPKQYIVVINGLIKSFDKNTGQPDNVLNINTDTFFDVVNNSYTCSDPRIRFDRHSGRWFIVMINVENPNNRIMIATSDSGIITPDTGWTFFYLQAGPSSFFDAPTLGIDPHALYIGGVTLSHSDTGEIFVVNKRSLFSGSAQATVFHNIINPVTGDGPYAPCGVDNFDADTTQGYFIGANNARFGTLTAIRVNDPDTNSPTISGNISIEVIATQLPIPVPHAGNSNGTNGYLDGNDDRILAAHIRNNTLWTAHAIGIDNTGASHQTNSITRNACRWYEIDISKEIPKLVQSGTLFTPSATNNFGQRSYWVPSVMTNGQGHMALGCSAASLQEPINAVTAGRFAHDELGKIRAETFYTSSSSTYNPAGDPGSAEQVRRWGNTSFTSVDPCDDMTMWTIQEYCNNQNSWGVRVVKLIAPPPAKPISIMPANISRGKSSIMLKIKGENDTQSGYFDPGVGFNCRLAVTIGGNVTVNNIVQVSPTEITIDVSTESASIGLKNITIRNPDGQTVSANILNIV